jgi:hypothetical protein
MALDFPTNPSDGDIYQTYVYNGTVGVWEKLSSAIKVSDTAPDNPVQGTMWWKSSTGALYVRYGSVWVAISGPTGADGADGAAVQYASKTNFPTSGNTLGQFVIAQDTKALYVWDGTEWDRVNSGSDEGPIILTEPSAAHELNANGNTSTVTMVAEDPEGFDITYGIAYKTTGNTLPDQLAAATNIDQSTGVYTFTPTTTTSNSGSFRARLSASDGAKTTTRFVDFSLSFIQSMFEPAGSTLLLGLSFDSSNTSTTGTYAISTTGSVSFSSDGSGIAGTEYATGWSNQVNYLQVTDLSAVNSGRDKTFIAWYKGNQTTSSSSNYSPGVPIFGDPSNTVWAGFGLDGGVMAACGGNTLYSGTTSVADDNWHMLAWTYSSTDVVDGFVDGVQEITGADLSAGAGNNRVNCIGTGYAYGGVVAPTALDNIQIFDGILTQSEIEEIYNWGVGV